MRRDTWQCRWRAARWFRAAPWEASAQTEEDLMKRVAAHAAEAHGVKEVTPELAARVKAAIQTR